MFDFIIVVSWWEQFGLGTPKLRTFTKKNEVHRGLPSTTMRLVRDPKIQDKISSQIDEYKKLIGDFGMSLAIRQREKLNLGII